MYTIKWFNGPVTAVDREALIWSLDGFDHEIKGKKIKG